MVGAYLRVVALTLLLSVLFVGTLTLVSVVRQFLAMLL